MKDPVRIIAEPPLFEEWLEREIEAADENYRDARRGEIGAVPSYWGGYLNALRRVRQELENGG